MPLPILVLIITQILFTISDLIARFYMSKLGFSLNSIFSLWFVGFFFVRSLGMICQLYVFANLELGKSMALLGAVSIVLSSALGLLVLKEVLSPITYAGVSIAVIAFIILAFS